MVRVRSPVTGGHIILCNAVANPNASFHLDPSIFLGRELSRLYCALLPLEGNTILTSRFFLCFHPEAVMCFPIEILSTVIYYSRRSVLTDETREACSDLLF